MQSRKIDSLTGLRFIAAFAVFLSHSNSNSTQIGDWIFQPLGGNGVVLFFTLSGFVICYNYFDRFQKTPLQTIWPFYLQRFARIYPLYFVVALASLFAGNRIIPQALPYVFTLTQSWFSGESFATAFNPVAWSLSVEVFFYLIFPLLSITVLRRINRIPGLVLLGVLSYGLLILYISVLQLLHPSFLSDPVTVPVYVSVYLRPLPHVSDFLLGCITARIFQLVEHRRPKKQLEEGKNFYPYFILVISTIMVFSLNFQTMVPIMRLSNLNSLFFSFIIFILARYPLVAPARFLSSRLMILLGEASYAFYLIHFLIIENLRPLLLKEDYSNPLTILGAIALLLLATTLAVLLFTFLEKPSRKFIIGKIR